MPVKLPAAYLMPLRQSAVSETLMFDFKGKLERSVGADLPPHPDVRACVCVIRAKGALPSEAVFIRKYGHACEHSHS